jgi:hypothetical protein
MNKFTVLSSHLATRFYKHHGWTEDVLKSCLAKGDLHFNDDKFGKFDMSYWILTVGSSFDVNKISEYVGHVYDYEGNLVPEQDKEEYLRSMNW